MPTLRDLIDGHTVSAAVAPPPAPPAATGQPKAKSNGKKSLSPGAQHVTDHLNDTAGMTKPGFQDLTKKKLDYDMARENMQRELAAPQAVIDHLSQIHGLVPGGMPGQVPTPGMTPNAQPGQDPNNPDGQEGYDEDGNPMPGQTGQQTNPMAQMNNVRPSQVGTQPGVAPGAQKTVVPPKLGVPKPGAPGGAGMPGQPIQKRAAAPPGAKKLPGAKGPGDPKVADKNKAAQSGTTGRQIKIQVHATNAPGARSTVAMSRGMASLKFGVTHTPGEMKARMSINPGGDMPIYSSKKNKMKAGPAQLADKVTDPKDQVAYNPVMRGGKTCKACGKMHAEGKCMKARKK